MNSRTPSPACPLFRHPIAAYPDSDSRGSLASRSSYTDATPNFYPMTSDQSDASSPVTEELEYELNNFINLQQQLQHNNTLTIHNLAHSFSSSESSNPTFTIEETRSHRVLEKKHLNARSTLLRKNFLDIFTLFPTIHV